MGGKKGMRSGHWDRHSSEAFWRGRAKARQTMKERGIAPRIEAIAGSMASSSLRRLGISRQEAPTLWENYYQLHLSRLKTKRELAAA